MRRKILVRTFLGLALVLLVGILLVALKSPRDDRNWILGHQKVVQVQFEGDLVQVQNVRNFRVDAEGGDIAAYENREYDLSDLASLWYVLAVFHEDDFRGPAHSMFSFGFGDSSYVVVSVEARKEVGESYSIYKGMLNKYEVVYVVGDEKDLILTRAVHRPDDVYLYPVKATAQQIRDLLVSMLEKADDLKTHPEFYNTVTNNCTTKLRDHVNQLAPGLIPMSWKVQLPGFSDELARDLELIDASEPLESARRRYWVNDRAALYADDPLFSTLIRSGPVPPGVK